MSFFRLSCRVRRIIDVSFGLFFRQARDYAARVVKRRKFNHGSWEVQRERHHILSKMPPSADPPASPVGDVLPSLLRQLGLEERVWHQALLNEWPTLVGEQLSRQTRPGQLERKVLSVYVTHPAWLSELSRYGQKQLLENLQKRFGADRIKSIRLQLDPGKA